MVKDSRRCNSIAAEALQPLTVELWEQKLGKFLGQKRSQYVQSNHVKSSPTLLTVLQVLGLKADNEAVSHVNTPLDGCTYPG